MADNLVDLQRQLKEKDEKILELQSKLKERDVQIQDIRSQLDQYKSILPSSRLSMVDGIRDGGRPHHRKDGVTGTPVKVKDLPATFKKYSKTIR